MKSGESVRIPQSYNELLSYLDYQNRASFLSKEEREAIWGAYVFAQEVHKDKKHESGDPYMRYPLAVAKILVKYHLDAEAVAAALLCDVLDCTSVSLETIEEQFGRSVATLVNGVSKLKLEQYSQKRQDAENLRKLLLAMISDVRVILIKLADRLYYGRILPTLTKQRREKIAREILEIFSPLAERLGMWEMKAELEDLSFRHLNPKAYNHIAIEIQRIQEKNQEMLVGIIQDVRENLKRAHLPVDKFVISGRPKHIFSIYKKMNTPKYEGQGIDRIYDKLGVRIIVNTIDECYTALGIIHSEWQPIPGEFDDYIGMRLPSGYQSLHTAVRCGPQKHDVVEFQIRTHDMHYEAEYGIAAHWIYKEQGKRDITHEKRVAWLRQMIHSLQQNDDTENNAETFVEAFKSEVLQNRVYIFTPNGDVIDLPQGATPIDFAYHIHTEVGHRCRGAKVNGRIVPLNYQLKNGEQVEVLTAKRGGPSRDWINPHLGCIKTSRARSKVRHWFKYQNYEENVTQGRSTLERELRRLGLSDINYEKLSRQFHFNKVEDFLAAIGRNDISTTQIIGTIKEVAEAAELAEKEEWQLLAPLAPPIKKPSTDDVQIQGMGNMLTNLAQCCRPVPGDIDIVGYITKGRGVTIHRRDCPNVLRLGENARERLIAVDWNWQKNATYPVNVHIEAFDRPGLLRDISAVVANEHINMSTVSVDTRKKEHKANVFAILDIENLDQLSRVLAKIEQLPNIIEVQRR
jgi:GTP pyrophosphokinase